jgi:hypothetical protein
MTIASACKPLSPHKNKRSMPLTSADTIAPRHTERHARPDRSAEAPDANSGADPHQFAKISASTAAHQAHVAAKRRTGSTAGNCAFWKVGVCRKERLPCAHLAVRHHLRNRRPVRPPIRCARRRIKSAGSPPHAGDGVRPARTPRRPHRTNSRRRSKTPLRLRTGLPLLQSPISRRQAGLDR